MERFGLGLGELILIALLAVIVIGPSAAAAW
jgi:Sec-independent protein translocase protein TatA